jgi:nicotinate-nucleotide adenylyltransferase
MNKLRVGILGGSFDPPTKSHIGVANQLIKENLVDQVWLMPCYVSYYDKQMVDPYVRLEMCKMETDKNPNLETCDFEVRYKLKMQTYDIMSRFLKEYDAEKYQFYFIMGMDNGNKIHTWDGWEELTSLVPFIIVPRDGYNQDVTINWYHKLPHQFVSSIVGDNGSSTKVRKEIKEKGSSLLVSDLVEDYIRVHKLYL